MGLPGEEPTSGGGGVVGRPLLLDTRVVLYDYARFLPGSPLLAAALHLGAWEARDGPSAFATVIVGLLDASSHGGAPAVGGDGGGGAAARRVVSPRHLRSPKAPPPASSSSSSSAMMLKYSRRRGKAACLCLYM
jgi:hypothetical protein